MLHVRFKKIKGSYHATISCSAVPEYNLVNARYVCGTVLTLEHSQTGKRVRGIVQSRRVGPFKGLGKRTVAHFILKPMAY